MSRTKAVRWRVERSLSLSKASEYHLILKEIKKQVENTLWGCGWEENSIFCQYINKDLFKFNIHTISDLCLTSAVPHSTHGYMLWSRARWKLKENWPFMILWNIYYFLKRNDIHLTWYRKLSNTYNKTKIITWETVENC